METVRVTINPELRELFEGALSNVATQIQNNANYIEILERGRVVGEDGVLRGSEQAPEGFVRAFIGEYEHIVNECLVTSLEQEFTGGGIPDLQKAAERGLNEATLRILQLLITRTPIDTSNARQHWQAVLNGGKTVRAGSVSGGTTRKPRSKKARERAREATRKANEKQ